MTLHTGFMKDTFRSFLSIWLPVIFLLLLLPATNSLARDVSFIWTANPETVDGYRIYYKTGSSGAPYDGVGAIEGPSPVTTGNVTTYTLTGLSDTETYYFVLTAYLGVEESGYSTEIVLPVGTAPAPGRSVTFTWTPNPETVDGYRMYYKTGTSGGAPYDGTGVTEGPSPISMGNVTTYTLNGLSETETYYFAITAYLGADESGYSDEIVLAAGTTPPTASDVAMVVIEDTPLTGQLPAGDPDGDALVYSIVTNATIGNAVITDTATGAFTYTPDPDVNGSDSFTFKVNDGTVDSNIATVTISITAVNDPPTVTGAAITTDEDTVYTGQLSGSDPDGDGLTYTIVTNGTKGSAVITDSATGAFTYTPNANVTGSDSFTFKVNDGTVDSGSATVSVTITAVNDPPTTTGASITTDEDTIYTGQLSGSDPDGDALTYTIVSNGTLGSAVITDPATGAFTYTPDPGVNGSDAFTFKVNDGTVDSNTATVSVTITAVNDPPTVTGAAITTDEDTVYTGQLSGSDPDGDALTYTIVSNGTLGSAVVTDSVTGAFTYTPDPGVNGSDAFTFKVNDGTVDSAVATVGVTINLVNEAPVVAATSVSTVLNTVVTGQLSGGDPDGDALTYTIVTNGTLGNAAVTDSATGAFTYTPNADATGSDSFTFKVNDGTVDSVEAVVSVTIFDDFAVTEVFGDTPDADYPGTVSDTYTNINTDINAAAETFNTWSWSPSAPHKVANTIIMKVDLTAIPAYATILEAKLYLYQTGSEGVVQYSNSIHKIAGVDPVISQVTGYNAFNGGAWTPVPAGTTYNDIPLGLADIDPQEDAIILFGQVGFKSWIMTNMVQEWIAAPSTNYGLLIQGEETAIATGRVFASTENQDATLRPHLVIRYRLIPPAPQLIMIEEIK